MRLHHPGFRSALLRLALVVGCLFVGAQTPSAGHDIDLTVLDETSAAVARVEVSVDRPGSPSIHLFTDYAGHARFHLSGPVSYTLRARRPGFYTSTETGQDPAQPVVTVVLNHEQMLVQQVNVMASAPDIDPEQVSDKFTMDVPEIVNIPYPTSRDIRNLLPFYPGVVQDATGQIHVAGSETWATLDLLDNFDIRSPISGQLAMRVSADAVRSIDQQSTRYPVQYGRATGGVVAFFTGMGDNRFRFNATNFIPSFHDINGIRFDKFVPRVTFSGPLARNRAWFFDGVEVEYDDIYIQELPKNADTNHLIRGSNLFRIQTDVTPHNILSTGVLFNDYHSPYDGISSLVPQISTVKRDTIAWLPYVRDQHSFANGTLFDIGLGIVSFRDGYTPHGNAPYDLTPELSSGSYFENLISHSQRVEGNGMVYLPPKHALGRHDLEAGIDLARIGFSEDVVRAPVNYFREDGTLLRRSTFPAFAPYTRHNVEAGAYVQDRWTPLAGILIEPGLRFDWDEIIRRPLFSPRFAVVYNPSRFGGNTKLSAGVGRYYEHTQLEYLARALAGMRTDVYYATDGMTPTSLPLNTEFTYNQNTLQEARALNWSVGLEQKLPASTYLKAALIRKTVSNEFVYADESDRSALSGNFVLTNQREDHDTVTEIEARHSFGGNYALFAAYTHSTAHTNAALDYLPTVSILGPQQPGPLAWDTPNRLLSWGWLPLDLPLFRKSWDFVYALDVHAGFPYTAVNSNRQAVGAANSYRFPRYVNFSPGLELRFHLHGNYLALRGVLENATGATNPAVVNNVIDSPQFGTFSEPYGRAVTARIRLIESK